MISVRFQKQIRITRHATDRMKERYIDETQLSDLIETGKLKYKDDKCVWIFKTYPERNDNMVCAAVILDDEIIVKTVMINWQLME